jgi:hypothetical protein
MAIYNDGKHNENMEHSESKFKITDKVVYRNAYFTIEGDDGKVYTANLVEWELYDTWHIFDEQDNDIEDDPKLYDALVTLCEESLNDNK